jgi:hypothetical protein
MPRTQKQIAGRYKGNLGNYNRLHRWQRALAWVGVLAIFGGIVGIILFQTLGRETFFNTGEISANHRTFGHNCASCHDKSLMTGGPLTPTRFRQVVSERFHRGIPFEPIDQKCETCHTHHSLHEPNVVQNRSCSACHQEHQGPGPMKLVGIQHCASCHNNAETMELSARKGTQLQWQGFHRHPHSVEQVIFELPRPSQGYTQTFSSLWNGHPEFQLQREKARDPDVLRFNHQRHFASDIPSVNGERLDCTYCHKPDPDGRYYQRISFVANCQACHPLRFDPRNPELTLPHGNAAEVRGFLRTLPMQYADLAVKKGITRPNEIQSFVAKQMTQLRERGPSGEELEREVFFTMEPDKPQRMNDSHTLASFYGCAFCNEVKAASNTAPLITKPILIDRWMPQAKFDHAKHASVKCDDCHHATQSRDTSDVLMPTIANCIICHSPEGKVVTRCITCHTYHAPPRLPPPTRPPGSGSSFKRTLLGESTPP